jgi:F-type H+-transporting ATPase subunit b
MPQLNQLPEIWWSQLFWLAVVFGFIFFAIGLGMLPKIQSTVDDREKKISGDLEAAQAARTAADETEAAWRARMDAARADAAKFASEAKQASAKDTEARVKAASDKLNVKVEAAEAKIRDAVEAARSEFEAVAAEAARDMLARLAGKTVDQKQAAEAVKAEMNG